MPFQLTFSERKVLGLPIEKDIPYKDRKPRKHGGRGTPKEQKTGTYVDMKNKIDKGFLNAAGFSQYLDKMDSSKYAKAIIDAYGNAENYRTLLTNVLRADKITSDRKLEIASMLLEVSSDHIIEVMTDVLQKEAIGEPLQALKKKLDLIIHTNRKNQRMVILSALMEKRSWQVNRLVDLRSDLYVYSVACKVCTQICRATSLEDALCGVRHEEECPYVVDKERVAESKMRDPKDARPLRTIFDHYLIHLPLKRITEGEGQNAVEKHLHFMPDDYKQYVLT